VLKSGNFIRAGSPGKKTRRRYRVDSIQGNVIQLTEMWRLDSDRTWRSSSYTRTFKIDDLWRVEVLRSESPEPNSYDEID